MSAAGPEEALVGMVSPTNSLQEGDLGRKLERCLRFISPVSPTRLHCCYAVIIVLTGAVIALSVALSLSVRRREEDSIKNTHAPCPRDWIGFGSRCFYFSENTSNWTFSRNFCKELEAQLAQFDSMKELIKGTFDYWIGLHRESPKHTWRWMDNTEYNSLLHCCHVVIIVLTAAVVALSVALSLPVRRQEQDSIKNTHAPCPRGWIGFGNRCFYFSENTSNWTFSQNFCMALEARLSRFDNMEELNFINRYKGTFDYWIGLHRESPKHTWRWMDNPEYNSSVPIQGVEDYAYLNNNWISSARVYADKRWICSKPNSYILQC